MGPDDIVDGVEGPNLENPAGSVVLVAPADDEGSRIDTAAVPTESVQAAATSAPAQSTPGLTAVMAAAVREGGGGNGVVEVGGIQRRVVVVGNTAHLLTFHPSAGPGPTAQHPIPPDPYPTRRTMCSFLSTRCSTRLAACTITIWRSTTGPRPSATTTAR